MRPTRLLGRSAPLLVFVLGVASGCGKEGDAADQGSPSAADGGAASDAGPIEVGAPPVPPGAVVAEFGPTRAIAPDWFGFNLDMGASFPWVPWSTDPSLQQLVRGLHAGTFRYPGGTFSNYFDWQTGGLETWNTAAWPQGYKSWALPTPQNPSAPDFGWTPQKYASVLPLLGSPETIFSLNVLTDTAPNQMAMLRQAEALGIPVRYVELGNELYFTDSYTLSQYPTPAAYGHAMTAWVQDVKAEWPAARVAVLGDYSYYIPPQPWSPAQARQAQWNQEVLQAVQGADAITLHLYTPVTWATHNKAVALTQAQIPDALGTPFKFLSYLPDVLSNMPQSLPVWVTEYSMMDADYSTSPVTYGPVFDTWSAALIIGEMNLLMLAEPRIERVNYHALDDTGITPTFGAVIGAEKTDAGMPPQWIYSAAGEILHLFSAAMSGASQYAPAMFGNVQSVHSTTAGLYPSILGGATSGSSGLHVVLMNLTPQPQTVWFDTRAYRGMPVYQIWSDPLTKITGPTDLSRAAGTVSTNSVSLPAYSFTLLGALP